MHEIKCSSPRKILLLVLLFPMCARSDSTIVRDELSSFFSTYDITRISNTKMSDGSSVLQLNVFGRILRAIVRNSTDVLHSNIRSSFSTSDGNPNHLQSIINAQYTGFLRGHPHLRVSMTELPTLAYFGQIETQNGTLIVEPVDMYSDHYDEKDIVVFYNRDVMIEKRMDFTRMSSPLRAPDSMSRNPMFYNPFEVYTKRRSRTKRETSKVVEDVKRNRCSLKVVADYHFFNKVARNSTARATRYILNMVANVNKIYTEQDFDAGVDDEELIMQNRKRLHGIGFSIKDIKIFDGPTEDKGHYNGPPVSGTEWRGTDLLNDFTSREGSRDFCLVVLLTAQLFVLKGELGLAWVAHDASGTAGICSGQSKDSYNTLFVTLLKSSEHGEGSILVSKEGEIVLAHELGHAFGAKHDNENPDPEDQQECFPDHASGGNYIMHMYAQQGYDANNVEFSPCSIRAIRRVLVNRNDCFDEEKRSLCGNGVLEPGEQCDEGDLLPDPHRNGSSCCAHDCQLMSNAQCSPVNFPCCNEQCRFHSNAFVCSPRNELQCQDKALCTGSSGECPAPTAVPDNTECLEDGRCSAGVCLPYCERKDIGKKSCICQDLKFTCFRCCSRLNTSTCEPEPSYTVLKDGTWCSQGICKNAKCITVAADSFNSNFNVLHDKAVLWDLLSRNLVIIVLIITVAVFTCCSIIVNNKDREVREEATRAQNAPIKRRMIAFHQIPQPGVDVVNSLL